MNPSSTNETDHIRSDIDQTRRRMDDTMDALGDRLQPRHLLDEVLGFLRGNSPDGETRFTHLRERVTRSCDTAMHSVVDTVKQNPMPALLIGAGVAWMIYESRRDKSGRYDIEDYSRYNEDTAYNPDAYYDQPLEYPSTAGTDTAASMTEQAGSKLGEMKDKLAEKTSAAAGTVKDKLAHAGEAAREKFGALRERAGEVGTRVREGTREAYTRTRERVVTTADQHPLEVGLLALAAGLVAGLAIPTPAAVNRRIGPTADRLRDRTRQAGTEMLEKGKRVAEAAVSAVKDEARAQGLTPENLREKASAVAERATEAGKASAEREGLNPSSLTGATGGTQKQNSPQNPSNPSYKPGSGSDPTIARPAV